MEYFPLARSTDAFQQPVEPAQIRAICQRAFGKHIQVESARELGGGLYNTTYLLHLRGMPPIILRVSPHPSRQARSEWHFMRNEHASLPFLAPIAPLLPRTLLADFTHQLLERDYLLQTFMEGEPCAPLMPTFTAEDQRSVFRQLGTITRTLHAVQGEYFSNSTLEAHRSSWSQTVLEALRTLGQDLEDSHLDARDVREVLAIAQAHSNLLDEISQPHLLHGDLWTVNLLVKRETDGPSIVAVLDSDRISWGDPQADWTMFLLHHHAGTAADAFWETYGPLAPSLGAQFRTLIYRGRHLGSICLEQQRLHHEEKVGQSYHDMHTVITALRMPPFGAKF